VVEDHASSFLVDPVQPVSLKWLLRLVVDRKESLTEVDQLLLVKPQSHQDISHPELGKVARIHLPNSRGLS
jgi:hypothetical protein